MRIIDWSSDVCSSDLAAQEKGWCGWRGGSDESPSPAAQEKGWFKLRGESCKPFSRLREKVPEGRMRGRERSEACLRFRGGRLFSRCAGEGLFLAARQSMGDVLLQDRKSTRLNSS